MNRLLCAGALLWVVMPVNSQVSKPTVDEATMSAYDIPGGAGFRINGLSKEPGLTDPRDFTGTWDSQLGNSAERFLAMRNAQARGESGAAAMAPPMTGPGMGVGGPGGPSGPGGGSFGPNENQTYKKACMPTVGVVSGGDGPVEIIQTSDQLTWMAEEMHAIRRIFLKGTFTPDFKPNYLGESIGHFEGDTLVVETRGMKSLNGGRMLERISKSEQGRVLTNEVSYVDAAGKPAGNSRTITLYYRPQSKMMEWICEDNGQVYQTGLGGREL